MNCLGEKGVHMALGICLSFERFMWITIGDFLRLNAFPEPLSTLDTTETEQSPKFVPFLNDILNIIPCSKFLKTINLLLLWDLRISPQWLWIALSFWIWLFVVLVEICGRFEGTYCLFLQGGTIYTKCGRLTEVASQKATFFEVVSPSSGGTIKERTIPGWYSYHSLLATV